MYLFKWIRNLSYAFLFITKAFAYDVPPTYHVTPSDQLQFGRLWQQVKRATERTNLDAMIAARREEITLQKDHWKQKLPSVTYQQELNTLLQTGTLEPVEHGCGAAYFLKDRAGNPRYVIKPVDEDVLCLHNRKQYGSPFNERTFRVRDHIPLYRTGQAEALSYAIAQLLGWERLTPQTHLAVLTHEAFFDVELGTNPETPQKQEKLCSVQKYVNQAQNLLPFIKQCLNANLSEEEVIQQIRFEDFENLCLLVWILFDTDAHAGNLYLTPRMKGGHPLLKIDNGLTFPEKNTQLLNALYYFPHAKLPLSKRIRKKIAKLPVQKICTLIDYYELSSSKQAFLERVEVLKKHAKNPAFTFRDMDIRLHSLSCKEGQTLAMHPNLSSHQLEQILSAKE